MAAGLGFKDFTTGEVLTAADVDGYLMQGIWVFADAAARDAAVTSPEEGNACYLEDTNEVLTYDGSTWVAVGGAGGGMTLISEQTASGLSSLSFTSLGSYKQLLLVWFGISHNVTGSTFAIRFNNSSGNNYYHGGMTASSAGTMTAFSNTATSLYASQSGQSAYPFGQDAYSAYAPYGLSGSLLIDNYTSSTKNKFYQGHWYYNNENQTYRYIADIQGSWNDTAAITSIDIVRLTGSATFSNTANSQIRLYGVS